MRQLFLPACLCVMAFSGPIGDQTQPIIEQLGTAHQNPTADVMPALAEAQPAAAMIADVRRENLDFERAIASDRPIAIPMQDEASLNATSIEPDAPIEADASSVNTPIDTPRLPKRKPEVKPVIHRSEEEVCDALTKAAQTNGLPVPFFIQLLFQESRFSPGVVSRAGAQGIAQFMPGTAADMGVDNPFDPLQAIPASARLLRSLFERFGNLGLAAAAYNAGPKRIQDWLAKKGQLPQETQGYVKIITGRPAEDWRGNASGTPAKKLPQRAPCQEEAGLLAWNGPDEIPTPQAAPHRRDKEPVVVAAAAPTKSKGDEKAGAKNGVKLARKGGRWAGTIKIADASGGSAPAGNADSRKKTATKDAKKEAADKGALQLAARKQPHGHKKALRISQR